YMLKNLHNTLYPSKDFASALQLFLIQHIAVMLENPNGGNGPGRMDRYLWPYLKEEWESGKLNHDQVLEMIEEAFMIMDDRIAPLDSWVEAIVVGGTDEKGNCAVNPLSYIMIEAMMELKNQTHPGVYVSLPKNAPSDFVELCSEYIIKGYNRGQIYGDENIRKALVKDGFKYEETCDFYAGGCMEVGIQGKMGDMHFAYALNVPLILEIVLNGGKTFDGKYHFNCPYTKTLCDYSSYEEFYEAFEKEYIREINMMHEKIDLVTLGYKNHRPMYLMSSMVDDCLGRGKSINDGGEFYGNYGGSVVGCANVGDSLYSIKKIFEDKVFSKEDVLEALRNDYKDNETMRQYFLNLPKYGSGCKEATDITNQIMEIHNKTVKNYNNAMGGHGVSIILGFVWSGGYGAHVGATLDGRHSGKALSQGMSPQNGACTEGITTAFRDAMSLNLENVAGGASMMWDLDPKWATKDVVKSLLLSYFEMGGHIFQGNVMNKEILQEALKNPEEYRDLIVRVGGYSDKFVKLCPELQKEIVNRYVHSG
ncbi:MAG: hypothetical protein KBT47_04085, partial [Armatimonadetes bacterium]|nr:hypothetical protein [Candidatus Hippobium faecium]